MHQMTPNTYVQKYSLYSKMYTVYSRDPHLSACFALRQVVSRYGCQLGYRIALNTDLSVERHLSQIAVFCLIIFIYIRTYLYRVDM